MRYIILGIAIMVASQGATVAGIEPFAIWNTPIAWTGFLVFADAVVYRARGDSWMRSSPREFIVLCLVSIPLWLVFEWFNLFLRNWRYVGLPENPALRLFGYAWSFATIWPAIFEAAELVSVWRARPARLFCTGAGAPPPARTDADASPRRGLAAKRGLRRPYPAGPAGPAPPAHSIGLATVGTLMLLSPLLAPPEIARYLAAPVWLGFILLLDPINAFRGEDSLLRDWQAGQFSRTWNLIISGFICGALWELWNFWARAKWQYTVPILENFKIFEMPLPGYLGFPAFALECFTMYVFVRSLIGRSGRPIAL